MKIDYSNSAEKELLHLERKLAQKIFKKISALENSPFGHGSEKLEGGKGYRIRIGDYRVIYTVNKEVKLITITKVAHRKEVYR